MKLEHSRREPIPGQARERHVEVPEAPLERQVVDRQHAAGRAEHGVVGVEALEVEGHQSRLPVVGVDDVARQVECPYRLERAPAQDDVASEVVAVVATSLAVDTGASVQLGDVQQERGDGRVDRLVDGGDELVRSHGDRYLDARRAHAAVGAKTGVHRRHDPRADGDAAQRRGEPGNRVGEAPRLREGQDLRGDVHDVDRGRAHGGSLPRHSQVMHPTSREWARSSCRG